MLGLDGPHLDGPRQGVQGGVWFSLIDKVYAPANLLAAFERFARTKGAAGVDHVTVEDLKLRRHEHLAFSTSSCAGTRSGRR